MPVSLAEVRKKYPQYAKLTDSQLAAGLYKKFYTGKMAEGDFYKKVGLAAPPAPPKPPGFGDKLLAEISPEGAVARVKEDIEGGKERESQREAELKKPLLRQALDFPGEAVGDLKDTAQTVEDVMRLPLSPAAPVLNLAGAGGRLMHALPGGDILAKGLQGLGPEAGAAGEFSLAERKALSSHLQAADSLRAKGVNVLGLRPEEALDNWLRHTYDQALAPFRAKLSPKVATGHPAMKAVRDTISHAYDTALEPAHGALDNELVVGLRGLQGEASQLGKYRSGLYRRELRDAIAKYDASGHINGKGFKATESDLRTKARGLRRGNLKDQKLADLLLKTADAMRENLHKYSPPEVVDALKKADTAYAISARIGKATVKAGENGGRFTPKQLLKAAEQGDPSRDHIMFQKGDALLQRHATEGMNALNPPKKPLLAGFMRRIPAWAIGGAAGEAVGGMLGGPFGLGREVGLLAGAGLTEPALGAIDRMHGSAQRRSLERAAREAVGPKRPIGPKAAMIAGSAQSERTEQP